MPAKVIEALDVQSRAAWRHWLCRHQDSHSEIWLVFHKRHTGRTTLSYNDAVEEALCHGWIQRVWIRHGDNNLQGFEVVKRCLHWLR